MCGISGVISKNCSSIKSFLKKSEASQLHRGPDIQNTQIVGVGQWSIGLGHQRLSILDLTEAGKQPMWSASSKHVIIYNGEVYNFKELEEKYLKLKARTSTDTEIVIEMIEKHGLNTALNLFNGMWAFAHLDVVEKKLYLSRDRVGIKPLYYTIHNGCLYFSSEMKGILEGLSSAFNINIHVVGEYICQSLQDTSNETFFNGIKSIPPGHYVEIDLSKETLNLKMHQYWDVHKSEILPNTSDVERYTKELFDDAVRLRMRSDVPFGVTLSGGIDSSAIASVMKNYLAGEQELNILSAVTPGSRQDESKFIDIMGKYLQSKVHKVQLGWDPKDTWDLMRKATWHNDSPLGSFSNVAHYLLMQKANQLGITVILSGQGADELLCGYKKYLGFYLQILFRSRQYYKCIKVLAGFIINKSIITQFNLSEAKRYLPSLMSTKGIDIRGDRLKGYCHRRLSLGGSETMIGRQCDDLTKFSVPFLTHYEDRMSMAWSREIRLPFLDYRLIELFINLQTDYKLNNGWTKYIFRKAFVNCLPEKIVWRKDKQGFINPQGEWLRKELKRDVLKLFSNDALIFKYKLIDRDALLQKYKAFCGKQKGIWYREIFNPVALEIWLQVNQKYIK